MPPLIWIGLISVYQCVSVVTSSPELGLIRIIFVDSWRIGEAGDET